MSGCHFNPSREAWFLVAITCHLMEFNLTAKYPSATNVWIDFLRGGDIRLDSSFWTTIRL
jgi:hypothetical protein